MREISLSGDELKQLREELLRMLLLVDRICRKHNISYCLGGGTLLGAVRHKGFIPWDDDADIFFLRDEYEKFRAVAPSEIGEEYFLQDTVSDPGAHYIYAKLRRNDSLYVTAFGDRQKMHKGIFLDIFVHDRTVGFLPAQKLHLFRTHYVRAMQVKSWTGEFYEKPPVLRSILNRSLRRHDTAYWDRKVAETVMRYRKNPKAVYAFDGIGEHLSHGVFPIAWITETTELPFEGHMLSVPKEYDRYLRFSYGDDYMTPPPENMREPAHGIVRVKFPGEPELENGAGKRR